MELGLDFTFAGAVKVQMNGIPLVYIDVPEKRADEGFQLGLTTAGELAPFQDGRVPAGWGLMLLPPPVAQMFRQAHASAIAEARRQAAAEPTG